MKNWQQRLNALYIFINSLCVIQTKINRKDGSVVLTGHNEDQLCQTVYNPHSFLLQSTRKYYKAKVLYNHNSINVYSQQPEFIWVNV